MLFALQHVALLSCALTNVPPHLVPPPSYTPLDEVVYAIHKPRNVLSAVGEDGAIGRSGKPTGHPTLTDIMLSAGVEPLPGHVGRLDVDTSGLILVTSDTLLLRACLNWPGVLDAFGGSPLTKRYSLLLAGRHEVGSPSLDALGAPLEFARGGNAYRASAAEAVEHGGCFVDTALASGEAALLDRHDFEQVERMRERLRAKRERPTISRATGRVVPPYVPHDGWLTRVELVLTQGRHHQVRRLVRKAGLRLLHLRRVAVGPIALGEDAAPGDVRMLGRDEKRALYTVCLPRLLARADNE